MKHILLILFLNTQLLSFSQNCENSNSLFIKKGLEFTSLLVENASSNAGKDIRLTFSNFISPTPIYSSKVNKCIRDADIIWTSIDKWGNEYDCMISGYVMYNYNDKSWEFEIDDLIFENKNSERVLLPQCKIKKNAIYSIPINYNASKNYKNIENNNSNWTTSEKLITAATAGATLYGIYKLLSNDNSSNSSTTSSSSYSSSSSNSDYAPQSKNGVEIVSSSTYGALAYEHAQVRLRNKNNYDVIVSIELKQNGEWEEAKLAPDNTDWSGYNYSDEQFSRSFKVKANSIRTVGLRGEGSGRPTNIRISYAN